MRVAQISTWQTQCGIAGYTQMLRGALLEAGVGCDVVPIDRAAFRYLTQPELRRAISELGEKASDADVVHIQHEFAFFGGAFGWRESVDNFGRLLAQIRGAGTPVAVTFHTEPIFELPGRRLTVVSAREAVKRVIWNATIARRFTGSDIAGIVHTRSSRLALVRSGLPAGNVRVLRQGTPPSAHGVLTENEARRLKIGLGFPENANVISMFGFISAYKGYRTAIRALKRLPPEYHLSIVGAVHPFAEDSELDEILALTARLKLTDRVHLAGFVSAERVSDYLAVTDVYVAPYRANVRLSSSAALTWALAAGKPIVASRIPAFVELNEEYHCLDLVSSRAPNELAFRIQALGQNPERIAELVEAARRYCDENQWSSAAAQHVALYERLLGLPASLPVAQSGARLQAVGD